MSERGLAAYEITTTSAMPRAIAAAACSACTSKLDPPTWVESVHAGWMPRYSASSMEGANPVPVAEATPSTSASDSPASSNASLIIRASAALPLMSSSPVGDTASAAPTMAARPRMLTWSREAMCPLLFSTEPIPWYRNWLYDTGPWRPPWRSV